MNILLTGNDSQLTILLRGTMVRMPAPPYLKQIFERERSRGFANLAGTDLTGRLPIPGEWLNQALREGKPEDDGSPVKGIALAIQDTTRGTLLVSLEQWPLPKLIEIPFLWDPKVETGVPGGPILRLTHEATGLLGTAIPLIIGSLKNSGIRAEGRHVNIALGTLLKEQGLDDVMGFLTRLELRGARGVLWVDFALSIPEKKI